MSAAPPDSHVVAVAVACLWRSPDSPRRGDAPMLAVQPRLREWLHGQSPRARHELWGRLDSQLLLGEPVTIVAQAGGWARVTASRQGAYPGWVRRAHLVPAPEPAAGQVQVTARTAAVYTAPGPVLLDDISFGTVLAMTGPSKGSDGTVPIRLPDGRPGVVPRADVAPVPEPLPAGGLPGAATLLATARRFRGVPYLPGGVHALSLDCSGLVHLVYRSLGVQVPRDARDQLSAGVPVPLDKAAPGDLLLFQKPGTRMPYHIGICTGPGRMLHASEPDRRCLEEPIPAWRRAHLQYARRHLQPPPPPLPPPPRRS